MSGDNGLQSIVTRKLENARLAKEVRECAAALEAADAPANCPEPDFSRRLKHASVSQGYCLGQLLDSEAVRLQFTEDALRAQGDARATTRRVWIDRLAVWLVRIAVFAAALALLGKNVPSF